MRINLLVETDLAERARAPGRSVLALCALVAACGGELAEPSEAPSTQSQLEGVSQVVTVPDPNGTYFAEVKANGTGCPPGTWRTSISSDGLAFTTTFSSYVAEVNPSVALSVKDCQLTIKLHTPNGRSFSVKSFSYSGFALLQPGVVGKQSASYYFQGHPAPVGETNRTDLTGPHDRDYVFHDQVALASRAWSPCGLERDLNVVTRVMLQNASPPRSGYMNLSAIDGERKIEVELESRSCTPATAPTSPSAPPAPPADPSPPATDPSPPRPSSALPDWAVPLLGRYAVRTDTYSISPLGPMLSDRQLALAEFVEVPGGLELRTRICSKQATSLGLTTFLRTPDAYPEVRQRVVLARGGWSTQSEPVAVGYERGGYSACGVRRGQRVPKRPEQTWIRGGTCVCGALSDPPSFDDCRVTDPDRDGYPGLAFKYRGAPEVDGWVAHVGTISRSRYVAGKVDPGGAHYASLKVDEATFYLACEPGGCDLPSLSSPCTSEYNGSQFHRLPPPPFGQAEWTCETLRNDPAALLPSPAPLTPNRCTRDQNSSAP